MRWFNGLLAALFLLAGCGDLPQPFRGNPGLAARNLAVPLAIRLAVPPPPQALLDEASARRLADAVTAGLQAQDVPAVATDAPLPLDWRLEISAENTGSAVRPRFTLVNADGVQQGSFQGNAVPIAAWAAPTAPMFAAVATQATPGLTRLLLSVQAARALATPAAISAGPVRIFFLPVEGAPGDGATALSGRMREFMSNQGYVIQNVAEGAQYGLNTLVRITPPANNAQVVDLQWIVTRRDGEELGRVVQVNEVPAGRLSRFWGDIAYVAAEQASGGVQTIIRNATESQRPENQPPAATPANAAVPPGLR